LAFSDISLFSIGNVDNENKMAKTIAERLVFEAMQRLGVDIT